MIDIWTIINIALGVLLADTVWDLLEGFAEKRQLKKYYERTD